MIACIVLLDVLYHTHNKLGGVSGGYSIESFKIHPGIRIGIIAYATNDNAGYPVLVAYLCHGRPLHLNGDCIQPRPNISL